MKKAAIILLAVLGLCVHSLAQENTMYGEKFMFYKEGKPGIKWLRREAEMTVHLKSTYYKDSALYQDFTISGSLSFRHDSSLLVYNAAKFVNKYKYTDDQHYTYQSESHSYTYNPDSIIYIPNREIVDISYTPTMYNLSGVFAVLSGTSALVAPVFSINYKRGDINSKTYFKILYPSLITFAVSFPLMFVFEERRVTVNPTPMKVQN